MGGGYQEQECGPYGTTLSQELGRTMRTNTAFSQFAWANAKQEGCHYPCPDRKLPSWPPSGEFIYPTLQKDQQQVQGSTQYDPNIWDCPGAAPWKTQSPPETSALTCAMTRAHQFLNADRAEKNPIPVVDNESKAAAEIARSILGGGGGQAKMPMPMPMPSSSPSHESVIHPSQDGEDDDEYNLRNLFPCIKNTFAGIAYDMANYDRLPTDNKFEYIVMRDDRYKYVVTTGLLFLFVILLLAAIITSSMQATNNNSLTIGGRVIDLGELGVNNLENMQVIIRPKQLQ
jgi:hypothetical protein